MKNKVGIIAAYTQDRLFDSVGTLLREQQGGPAFFASNLFKKLNMDYSIVASIQMSVRIIIKDRIEVGEIQPVSAISIDYSKIKEPYLLISPILNEFDLNGISTYKGRVFLDMQGFIRVPGSTERKKWEPSDEVRKSVFCLKISDYELPYVDSEFVKQQKKKMLLLTSGKKGSTLFAFGKKYFIKPEKIVSVKETIGAGDTYLASFVCKYIKTENPLESAEFATEETAKFLSGKGKL